MTKSTGFSKQGLALKHWKLFSNKKNRNMSVIIIVPAAVLYFFFGTVSYLDYIARVVERNRVGFIPTGPDLIQNDKPPRSWTDKRSSSLLETNVPGIFAAGDVREGAVRRVASAVGNGAIAVSLIHQYLKTV